MAWALLLPLPLLLGVVFLAVLILQVPGLLPSGMVCHGVLGPGGHLVSKPCLVWRHRQLVSVAGLVAGSVALYVVAVVSALVVVVTRRARESLAE